MVFVLGRAAASVTTSGDFVSKVVFFLLVTIPYQGFFIWAAAWLTLDSVRERRRARAAAAEISRSDVSSGCLNRRES
ncbi:hypothetical protein [Actinophytocola sp.]|uniref:hypothetical protein n=1 Tax=Actinophytocola sp. TaxID=1872138 RepID=UPI0038998C6A